MQKHGKILVVTQHYPPDSTTTAVYLAAIAEGLAIDNEVIVLSGSPNSASQVGDQTKNFFATLMRTNRGDIIFCVTTPFTLPYADILAARLRGAATALLIYDL